MQTKILVTGSCGFIGSNFIRKSLFEKMPYKFASIDRVSKKQYLNTVYANKNHQFYLADITDAHILDCVFELEQPDWVVHFAAQTHVDDSIKNADTFMISNVLGTQRIIDSCLKHNSKLLMISTDECYGSLSSEDEPSWKEDAPLCPRNPYSASKAACENIVKAAGVTHGLQYIITRSSNNYGPRQSADKLIPKVIKQIINNKPIPMYGNGSNIRDWTHVWDNCSALMTILSSGKLGETYNISANQEFSNLEVLHEICKAMGRGTELIQSVPDRLGHDYRYSVDTSKLRSLGWKPSFKFKYGIQQTVEWYTTNNYFLNLEK